MFILASILNNIDKDGYVVKNYLKKKNKKKKKKKLAQSNDNRAFPPPT